MQIDSRRGESITRRATLPGSAVQRRRLANKFAHAVDQRRRAVERMNAILGELAELDAAERARGRSA